MTRTSLLSILLVSSIVACTGRVVDLNGDAGDEASSSMGPGSGSTVGEDDGGSSSMGMTGASGGGTTGTGGGSSGMTTGEDASVTMVEDGGTIVAFPDSGVSMTTDASLPACACAMGDSCVITTSPGPVCVSPDDGGACPPDTLEDGASCCFVSISYGCRKMPKSCAGTLTCGCAGAELCGMACTCTGAAGNDLECECP